MKKTFLLLFVFTTYFSGFSQNYKNDIIKYLKSTVTIFLDDETKSGSGFIIENGRIITNLHVIEGSENGYVIVNGTSIKHKIDGFFDFDEQNDLAILSVPTLKGLPLVLADVSAKTGDKVFAFENPIISPDVILEGTVKYTSVSDVSGIIKISIPLIKGNSGGALVNTKGQILGVVSGAANTSNDKLKAGYAVDVLFLEKFLSNKNQAKRNLNIIKGAYFYLSQSELKCNVKDYTGALLDLNKSIELNPKLFMSYYNRGNVRLKLNDFEGSIDDCSKSIQIIPDFVLAYNIRGLAKLKLNDLTGAIKDFDKSIKIDSDFAPAYSSRGMLKAKLKDFEGAIQDLNKAIAIDPENEVFYIGRGGINFFSGNKKEGCIDFEKAKKLGFADAQELINKFCN